MSSIKYPLLFPGFALPEDNETAAEESERIHRQEAAARLLHAKMTPEELKKKMKEMTDERMMSNARGQRAIDWWQPIYEEVLCYTLERESRGPVAESW